MKTNITDKTFGSVASQFDSSTAASHQHMFDEKLIL